MTENSLDIPIEPSLDEKTLKTVNKLSEQLNFRLDHPSGIPAPVAETGILENIGRLLWTASNLDPAELLETIEDARDDERPVRLIIKGSDYYHLPWELLYSEHPEIGFAGRHSWCTVLRRIRGRGDKRPSIAARPLKILLFVSSPDDLDPEKSRLDFEMEEELLFTALDRPFSKGEIDIHIAEDGCLSTLMEKLEHSSYHAVILSMHGAQAKNSSGEPEWGLLFEDETTWKRKAIPAGEFAEKLGSLPKGRRPGLVVISACRSARGDDTAATIGDVAGRLHQEGVERVLGMRLSVMDSAASVFSAELFRRLSQGETVGRAISLARNVTANGRWAGPPEKGATGTSFVEDPYAQWSLPVLLDRTMDGPLLDPEKPAEISPRPPHSSVLVGDGSLSLPQKGRVLPAGQLGTFKTPMYT